MRLFFGLLTIAAGLMLADPTATLANPEAAAKCRAGLPPQAALIYDKVRPLIHPTADIQNLVRDMTRDQTRALVEAGAIQESTARDNAMAAGQCFRALGQ